MSAKAFAHEIVRPGWEERRGQDRLRVSIINIRRNKLLALAVFLLCVLSSTALAFLLPSYWRAEIELMPVSRTSATGLGSIAAGLGGMLGTSGLSSLLTAPSSSEDEALAVLRSRELFDGYATRMNLLPVLYASKWDATASSWTVESSQVPTLRQAYRLFDRQIREIDLDRRSGIVTLGITWKDRQLAVQWARDFVDLTNRQLREEAISEAKANMSYLTQEMHNVRDVSAQTALIAALASAYERQLQQYIFAQGQKDFAFRIIDPPTMPDIRERVSPQRTLIIAIGTLAGIVLAFAAVQLRELFRHRPQAARIHPELRP
jgi:uncharacterized protein involved in exopolysaccharide biosynthesis